MRVVMALLVFVVAGVAPAAAADALGEARRLYNLGQYETAANYAREALKSHATMESARLVLGRIQLERFRRTADPADLNEARDALKHVNPEQLDGQERAELSVGLGQCLFLEDRFGAASEAFERSLDVSWALGPEAHERVLDWWATALDRLALSRPRETRDAIYARIVVRMEKELALDPASAPAAYWLAAGLRGSGNLDRAWFAAIAGWVSGMLGRDHGAALRADLEKLMVQGIIPERAARLQPRDAKLAAASMQAEWEALKASWTR
jgi:hypothetical protein